jgi:hypothetical protein
MSLSALFVRAIASYVANAMPKPLPAPLKNNSFTYHIVLQDLLLPIKYFFDYLIIL